MLSYFHSDAAVEYTDKQPLGGWISFCSQFSVVERPWEQALEAMGGVTSTVRSREKQIQATYNSHTGDTHSQVHCQLELQPWPPSPLDHGFCGMTLRKYFPPGLPIVMLVYSPQLILQPLLASIDCPSRAEPSTDFLNSNCIAQMALIEPLLPSEMSQARLPSSLSLSTFLPSLSSSSSSKHSKSSENFHNLHRKQHGQVCHRNTYSPGPIPVPVCFLLL